VASVGTLAGVEAFPQCRDTLADAVTSWAAAGRYWSVAIPSLCSNGLRIGGIERSCRPTGVGSDHVIAVLSDADPRTVYEDVGGLRVDVSTLAPGTRVIVLVATGIPCG
jgi:hypothetical protein